VPSLTLLAWLVLTVAPSPQPFSVSGTVVDPEGKPVEGATVWLTAFVRFDADVEELAEVETDVEGRFVIDAPVGGGDRHRSLTLWAHAPGKRVASVSPSNRPKDDRGPIRLALGPPVRTPVRVLGDDGKPLAGATVRLTSVVWPAGLRARLEATTDARGRAAIEGVNPGQIYSVDVTALGFGTQRHDVPQDEAEKTAQLLSVGRVTARIVSDDPKALAGWTVVALSHPAEASNLTQETNATRGRSDESGRVALGPLAAGRISFSALPPEGSPFLPLPATPAPVTLRGGESVEVEIPVRKGVKVEGSVREHGSARPATGVKVNLYVLSPYRRNEDVVTDAEGRFSRYFLPCNLRVSLTWFDLPDRYFHAPGANWADYDLAAGEEVRTLAPLEVWPAVAIKGTVVDEADKPAEGVQVSGSCIARAFGDQSIPGSTLTDERGAFVLGRMAPDSTVEVRAGILSRADSQPVTVRLDGAGVQDGPVALKLVKRPTVALRGRVRGPEGLPVAGARVTIEFRTGNEQNVYGNGKEEEIRTGPDGTFQTPNGVPRSDQYRAQVTAPGMELGVSGWATAPAVDLPDVILRRTARLRSVAGRVVDAHGQAVAGAEVFQSGDGPRRTNDTTDTDGRFTIRGVFDAPAFVFVKKAGYRFTGRRIGAGDEPVTVVVSKVDGPAPVPLKPVPPPWSRAEERAKASALVAPLWKDFNPGEAERSGPYSNAPILALVDTARVVGMIEDQVLNPDGALLANVALGLYEADPRDAVETLDAVHPPATAAEVLLELADRVPDAPAGVRDDLLTRALARAREVDEAARRVALTARVADRRFEAGEREKARSLVDEARAAFKSLDSGASLDARDDLANALARVDLPAALALLEPGKNEANLAAVGSGKMVDSLSSPPAPWKNEANLANIARRAAANDPAGAERIFDRLTRPRAKLDVLANLCAGMAEHDLQRALALAKREDAPGVAALTVAVAARNRAPNDPAGAKKPLADAYDRLEPLMARMVVPSVSMARLLPLAIRVDPDRSSEYLWRAIAARLPRALGAPQRSAAPEIQRQYLVVAQLAALVARYDREAAETIFAPVAENAQALIDDRFDLTKEAGAILQAAAAFDPRAALAMIDALPADPEPKQGSRPGSPPAFAPRINEKARLAVARALALPPGARRREALRVPGQPDLWPAALDD
jgi:Carboxypeptidase regulatory-like domain